ncbi:MAG: ABC transporter substrate-binding protein, partial [Synergistaceae bacterium]|nr:ABC transporter substrate-binding protein [Synergistaceae bacterium]
MAFAANPAAAAPKIAIVADYTEPYIDLDPSAEYSNGIRVLQNIYETLTRYDASTQKLEPLLAESWSVSPDGKTWTFEIRRGVKFHDGADLDAAAVKGSIERTINMKKGAAYIWDAVQKIETTGDFTVVFTLDRAAPVDLIASAAYAAFIISPKAVDKGGDWFNEGTSDGGTGPYTLSGVQRGEQAIMKKFDGYWRGWSEGQIDGVIIKKYSENSSRRLLIEKGEAQITNMLSTSDLKALKENPSITVYEAPSWRNIIGFWNTEKPPLDNADLRRALNYAYPYDEVITNVLEGRGVVSKGIVPSGLWGHDDTLDQPVFDMERAEEYLKKSGVDPSSVKLEATIISGSEVYRSAMQIYRANLRKLGIEINVREMTWDSLWEKSKSESPA